MQHEWNPAELSWEDFRGKILGPMDPASAPEGSIRRAILNNYVKLGLDTEPNRGDNGVHASASPFEGISEKSNWLGRKFSKDSFGKALLDEGISEEVLLEWCKDPAVKLPDGTTGSLFDALEDTDVGDCLQKIVAIHKSQ